MNASEVSTTYHPWFTTTALVLNSFSNVSNATISSRTVISNGFTLPEVVAMTTAMVILILVTCFGNGLVLGIFYEYTPLRTVTNYFIVSLANADLLVALISTPIWIAYLQVNLMEFQFGKEVYRFWICIDITSGVSSVMNLSFVSVDRYIHILMPLHYHGIMTSKRGKVIIFCIWLYAIALALIKGIAFRWAKPNYEILVFIMGFLLPLLVMGWCYYKIFGEARLQQRALNSVDTAGSRDRKKQFKAAKTIAVVILAFFICWCPFFVLNLFHGFFPNWPVPRELITVTKWLHYMNSALNPIIYACFNHDYRSAFKTLLTRKFYRSRSLSTNKRCSNGKRVSKNGEDIVSGLRDKLEESKTKFKLCEHLLESSV